MAFRSKQSRLVLFLLLVILPLLIVVATIWLVNRSDDSQPQQPSISSTDDTPESFNKAKYSLTDPTSLWVIANKNHPLPSDYAPTDLVDVSMDKRLDKSISELKLRLEAATSLQQLNEAAKADGINFQLGSGYRSYELQEFYYTNYVRNSGQAEADRFSAMPGKSEHQTGLAADLGRIDGKCYLETCFAETPEGQWLANNAYTYGFIIRYPEGKETITGYQYEPWHVRYVGAELAEQIYSSGQTMEEFSSTN